MEYFLIALVPIIIITGIATVILGNKKGKEYSKEIDRITEQMVRSGIEISDRADWNYLDGSRQCSVLASDNKEMLYVYTKDKDRVLRKIEVPFDNILGFEIEANQVIVGSISKTVVGGIIGGDVGALIGAASAQSGVSKLNVVIQTNQPSYPRLVLKLIDFKTKIGSPSYDEAVEFANGVRAIVNKILVGTKQKKTENPGAASAAHETAPVIPTPVISEPSPINPQSFDKDEDAPRGTAGTTPDDGGRTLSASDAYEIIKRLDDIAAMLHDLHRRGLISDEEYEDKRRSVLETYKYL